MQTPAMMYSRMGREASNTSMLSARTPSPLICPKATLAVANRHATTAGIPTRIILRVRPRLLIIVMGWPLSFGSVAHYTAA